MKCDLKETETYFIAYWPGEGGAQPVRLGGDKALAVWDSEEAVRHFGSATRSLLQPVKVSRATLDRTAEPFLINPAA